MSAYVTTRTESGYQVGNLVAEKLPHRQSLTLIFAALGLSEKQSAKAMNCSISSVKQAKQALFFKLRANNSSEVITKAFASAYLRFLSVFIATIIGTAGPALSDHNTIARFNRTRAGSQLRARNNLQQRNGGGIYWSPETGQLIFA